MGERLITAKSEPVFGGVYKLSAVEDEEGHIIPKIKISENVEKITNPGYKAAWRLFSKETGKAIADVITMADEEIDESKPYEIFHPGVYLEEKNCGKFHSEKAAGADFLKQASACMSRRVCKKSKNTAKSRLILCGMRCCVSNIRISII